eukprot:TRINITY_DN19216_c0_g1_i1.p1 TRINITY_DN19216_c0_g1~~TRINITY_DN19216_c0_g1_i1.p1  ORF type:complete len:234 (+),score=50.88 TRINITY_DN19216_c0_g1_i1:49-750(+)
MLRRTIARTISIKAPFSDLNVAKWERKPAGKSTVGEKAKAKAKDVTQDEVQCRVVGLQQLGPLLGKNGMYSYELVHVVDVNGRRRTMRNFNTVSLTKGECVTLNCSGNYIKSVAKWVPPHPLDIPPMPTSLSTMTGTITNAETTSLEWGGASVDSPRNYNNAASSRIYAHWYTFLPHGSEAKKTLYHPSISSKPHLRQGYETTVTYKTSDANMDTLDLKGYKIVSIPVRVVGT